ncbi:prepilin peptidase, partial [Salmonella enterica]|nr:prepilin peptidase [Salmonella enterica]
MTVALVGTFFPTVYAIPAFIGSAILGAVLLLPVRLYLAAAEVDISRHCAGVVGIWLFAVTGLLILMAPQDGMIRIGMLLMCGFLLQLGVMDAASGWLPRPFTAACLCSGLLFCFAFHREPEIRVMETAAMAVVMGAVCHGVNRRRPQLGVGDVWLLCALVAWMGVTDALQAAFMGL